MAQHLATTPFGRRSMSLGQMATQAITERMPENAKAHKWEVLYDIRQAREAIGATDRSLTILEALLSFHPETTLAADGELVVFPSNEQLIGRANGMPPSTLRRHLFVLVSCGLIIRRDSPNGKRFARRGLGGAIEQAYGFDLAPIVARAAEFKQMAETVREEKKAYRLVKERLTICRRDIVKMIDTGLEEGVPANWGRVQQAYQDIVARLPRTPPRELLEEIATELDHLWTDIREVLESFIKSQNLSGNESQNERHIQNSNPDSISESKNGLGNRDEAGGSIADTDNVRSLPKRELPLGIVLDACPNMLWLVKGGGSIRNWREFLAAAEVARPAMGISPSAWEDARTAMGEQQAAITVAAIYQRADQINSAGGYLRSLTDRAKEGKFSVWPMVMALLRAKLDASKPAGQDVGSLAVDLDAAGKIVRTESRLEISDALRRSLEEKGRGS